MEKYPIFIYICTPYKRRILKTTTMINEWFNIRNLKILNYQNIAIHNTLMEQQS